MIDAAVDRTVYLILDFQVRMEGRLALVAARRHLGRCADVNRMRVESIELNGTRSLEMIESRYRDELGVAAAFFRDRAGARYVTLIRFDRVRRIPALRIDKRDRNAWKKGRKYFQVALGSVEAAQVVIAKDRLKVKTDRQLLMGLIAGLSTPASR